MWSTVPMAERSGISDKRLSYFVTLVEQRSFARAAEMCGISQSALSQQIVKLETDIGAELVDRTVRPIDLSPAGHKVYALALDILDGYREVSSLAQEIASGAIGRVRIGVIPSLLYLSSIPEAIRRYREEFPHVQLDLRRMDNVVAVNRLFDRHLDVIFSYSHLEGKGLSGVEVDRDAYLVALPQEHRLADREKIGIVDLREDVFLSFPRDAYAESQDDIVYAARSRGFSPTITPVHATFIEQTGFVAAGFGVALVPSALTAHPLAGVRFVPLEDELLLPTYLYWREEVAEPAVQGFVRSIQDSMARARSGS